MSARVLVLGGGGQLGRALALGAPPDAVLLSRREADLTDPGGLARALARHDPAVVLNAAAWTAVDRAEEDPEGARAVNARGVETLARLCAASGRRLVHVSTDYVFDGRTDRPYRPEDPPSPINVYGATKREGEEAVLRHLGTRGTVVRTSWLYGPWGTNFLLAVLARARRGETLRVVDDQRGAPTSTLSLARVLWRVAERDDLGGIWHWADGGETSRHGFARAILEGARARGILAHGVSLVPIASHEWPQPAPRPARSTLDASVLAGRIGLEVRPWEETLAEVLDVITLESRGGGAPTGAT